MTDTGQCVTRGKWQGHPGRDRSRLAVPEVELGLRSSWPARAVILSSSEGSHPAHLSAFGPSPGSGHWPLLTPCNPVHQAIKNP